MEGGNSSSTSSREREREREREDNFSAYSHESLAGVVGGKREFFFITYRKKET